MGHITRICIVSILLYGICVHSVSHEASGPILKIFHTGCPFQWDDIHANLNGNRDSSQTRGRSSLIWDRPVYLGFCDMQVVLKFRTVGVATTVLKFRTFSICVKNIF